MKIVVTYEASDIVRLIRADLEAQGISANEDDIKFTKNKAVVSVEVARDDAPDVLTAEQRNNHTHDVVTRPDMGRSVPPSSPPRLETIEGGANAVDMDAVLRASQKAASQTPGKFPAPERQLMDGESFDYPGDKR